MPIKQPKKTSRFSALIGAPLDLPPYATVRAVAGSGTRHRQTYTLRHWAIWHFDSPDSGIAITS
jgi:hypothetical protein